MITASLGSIVAADLGIAVEPAHDDSRNSLGKHESLIGLMEDTPLENLHPDMVHQLRAGAGLKDLVAAAALSNARAFGGEDYVGMHVMMALRPAYEMACELPSDESPLPILKVLYRNATRMQQRGHAKDVLQQVMPTHEPAVLRDAVRNRNLQSAEAAFATAIQRGYDDGITQLFDVVTDAAEVHRVVLAYRAWDMVELVGADNAHTVLRQALRYCVQNESDSYRDAFGKVRDVVPSLLERFALIGHATGHRHVGDQWVEHMSHTLFESTPDVSAEAVAAALKDGVEVTAICDAISLAANQLVLRDNGRPRFRASGGKPFGSVHGDSIGVHASDAAHAWCNVARINQRHRAACLLLAAYQVAYDRTARGGDFLNWEPYPRESIRSEPTEGHIAALIARIDEAIRANDQSGAAALVATYGSLGLPDKPVLAVLRKFAISEDGALHAEKYYRTCCDNFQRSRRAFRWRHVIALARVTASAYGNPAPGYMQARDLLNL